MATSSSCLDSADAKIVEGLIKISEVGDASNWESDVDEIFVGVNKKTGDTEYWHAGLHCNSMCGDGDLDGPFDGLLEALDCMSQDGKDRTIKYLGLWDADGDKWRDQEGKRLIEEKRKKEAEAKAKKDEAIRKNKAFIETLRGAAEKMGGKIKVDESDPVNPKIDVHFPPTAPNPEAKEPFWTIPPIATWKLASVRA